MAQQVPVDPIKFPIGCFELKDSISSDETEKHIQIISEAPTAYRELTAGLSAAELSKTYREGAWNIQQLINHVADIQLLHFFRMKKTVTEPDYSEATLINMNAWASSPDGMSSLVEDSLLMFDGITRRYVNLMRSLNHEQLGAAYFHTVRKISFDQRNAIALSAWHVRHHLAHIEIALASA